MSRTVRMIDVSKWQASDQRYPPVIPMNWVKAKLRGVLGAYIKASEALSTDPELYRNNDGAGAENIKRGAYHYFREAFSGLAQAKYFLSRTGSLTWELPPALDVEVPCSAKELWAFVEYVFRQTGRWCLIYTGPGAWGQVKDSRVFPGLKTYKQLIAEHCDLWQAQYPHAEYDDGSRVMPLDQIPYWPANAAVIHQYSAKNQLGAAYGSKGSKAIDLDLADAAWFDRWPWPGNDPEPEAPQQEDTLHTRFVGMVNGQNLRSEPSTRQGTKTVVGRVNAGQILFPARDMVIKNAGEVWLRFDTGWAAVVHGGKQYLKAVG